MNNRRGELFHQPALFPTCLWRPTLPACAFIMCLLQICPKDMLFTTLFALRLVQAVFGSRVDAAFRRCRFLAVWPLFLRPDLTYSEVRCCHIYSCFTLAGFP
ncbi:unnamed protein product [Polarella glacialis]|uniref:Uncharacterized protein n=1 Tax=Polarella glacialis TaxID=89957 RepID=A0A813LBB6_POLGL|nr:unnamed protein product [Polarella glacialis]CAE8721754.1 unnamed protein product [Polarella glacialis]